MCFSKPFFFIIAGMQLCQLLKLTISRYKKKETKVRTSLALCVTMVQLSKIKPRYNYVSQTECYHTAWKNTLQENSRKLKEQ